MSKETKGIKNALVTASVAALAAATLAGTAGAAVLVNDGFDGAAGDTNTPFFVARNNSSGNITVATADDPTLGTGNALMVTANSGRSVAATFADTALADGDSISLSFDLRLAGTIPASDRGFRFGLYNNGGTAITADTAGTAQSDDDSGYIVRLDTGTATTNSVAQISGDPAATLLGGTLPGVNGSSDLAGYALTTTDAHSAVFTIARSGDTLALTFQLDALAPIVGSTTVGDDSFTTTTFNEFAIGSNANGLSFNIDNVVVSNTPAAAVPEPASLSLLAVGMGGLTLGRRRRL